MAGKGQLTAKDAQADVLNFLQRRLLIEINKTIKKENNLSLALLEQSKAESHKRKNQGRESARKQKEWLRRRKQGRCSSLIGRVHEGDQIVGATIYFDNMSSEETAELLKTLHKHKVGLKLQNKDKSPCRSPMGTLSPCRSPIGTLTYEGRGRFGGSSPDIILSGDDEDYKRIYSKKIKPRLKSEDLAEGVDVRTERHSSTSSDGSTITTITRRITTYTVDMPEGIDEQPDLTGPEFKGSRYEQSGGGSSSQIRVSHGSDNRSVIGGGRLEGGGFEVGGDGASLTGPRVTSTSEKHWSTGGMKTTIVTREIEGGDGGTAGIKLKGPSFGMSGAKSQGEFSLSRGGQPGDRNFQVSSGSNVTSREGFASSNDGNAVEFDIPSADYEAGSVSVTVPGRTTNTSSSSISMGKGQMKGVDFNLAGRGSTDWQSRAGVSVPGITISDQQIRESGSIGPTFKGEVEGEMGLPKADIEVADIAIDSPDISPKKSKFKMPKFGFKGPKVKSPDVDVKLGKPDINIKGPKGSPPDLEVDIGATSPKVKGSKFKMPKFGFKSPKIEMPDVDINLPKVEMDIKTPEFKSPDIDIESSAGLSLPKADINIEGPELDIEGPDGKVKGPKFKMPSISGPKISMPDVDFNIKGPKIKGDFDVSVPKIEGDIKAPKLDIEGPDIDVEGPGGKIKGPKFKMPSMSGPKISMPDMDFNLKGPKLKGDVDISIPKMEGELKTPKVDIEGPDVDIEGSGGFKMPKMKMPSFGFKGPKLEGPDVDINLPKAGLNIEGPDVDIRGPELDIEGPDGKIKGPKFKMPSISGPNISMPDVDFNLRGPKLKGGVDMSGDIKAPKLDVEGPDVDIEGSGGFKMPKMKMPSFGMKGPKLEGPDVDINIPKADIDIKGPKVDIKTPDIDLEGPEGKIKGPKFKMPSISGPNISMPDMDFNLKGPKMKGGVDMSGDLKAPKLDIEGPDVDIEGSGGFKMPKMKMPSFGMKGPKLEGPDLDINLPKASIDIKGPKVDIKTPDIDLEGPEGKIKGPKFKMPSISGPNISMPDVDFNLKGPKMKGGVDMSGDLKAPKLDIEGPDVDIEGSGGFKMPKMKMPSFGMKGPKLEGPDVDINLPKADIDIKGPKVDIQTPDIDLEGPEGKIKGPKFKMPSISGPNISMPDVISI
ncbi:hypothetical protein UPYG_G00209550 [Umbra pygmaea]|uniref:Neuroblast differentiation-associated protein AHNAK-like n=1 Tax=Umbra pygmaea TaxID=75934 RepID=A0ABD0X1J7_UMBPY